MAGLTVRVPEMSLTIVQLFWVEWISVTAGFAAVLLFSTLLVRTRVVKYWQGRFQLASSLAGDGASRELAFGTIVLLLCCTRPTACQCCCSPRKSPLGGYAPLRNPQPVVESPRQLLSLLPRYQFFVSVLLLATGARFFVLSSTLLNGSTPSTDPREIYIASGVRIPDWYLGATYATQDGEGPTILSPLWYGIYWLGLEFTTGIMFWTGIFRVPSSWHLFLANIFGAVMATLFTLMTLIPFTMVLYSGLQSAAVMEAAIDAQRVWDVCFMAIPASLYGAALLLDGVFVRIRGAFRVFFIITFCWHLFYALAASGGVIDTFVGIVIVAFKSFLTPLLALTALSNDTAEWQFRWTALAMQGVTRASRAEKVLQTAPPAETSSPQPVPPKDAKIGPLGIGALARAMSAPSEQQQQHHYFSDQGDVKEGEKSPLPSDFDLPNPRERRADTTHLSRHLPKRGSMVVTSTGRSFGQPERRNSMSSTRDALLPTHRLTTGLDHRQRKAYRNAVERLEQLKKRGESNGFDGKALMEIDELNLFVNRVHDQPTPPASPAAGARASRHPPPSRSALTSSYGAVDSTSSVEYPSTSAVAASAGGVMDEVSIPRELAFPEFADVMITSNRLGEGGSGAIVKQGYFENKEIAIKLFTINMDRLTGRDQDDWSDIVSMGPESEDDSGISSQLLPRTRHTSSTDESPEDTLRGFLMRAFGSFARGASPSPGEDEVGSQLGIILGELFTNALASESPYVVSVYGATCDWTQLGILYEYCNRGTLQTALKDSLEGRNPLSLSRRLRLATQAALAVRDSHKRNLVHRDIKSNNFFLKTAKEPRNPRNAIQAMLGDFGLASLSRSTGDEDDDAQWGMAGTLLWYAPELVDHYLLIEDWEKTHSRRAKKPKHLLDRKVSTKTDVYALGLVLTELWNQTLPWVLDRPNQPLPRTLHDMQDLHRWAYGPTASPAMDDPQHPHAGLRRPMLLHCQSTPPGRMFAQLVERCLHINPDERPKASHIVRDLIAIHEALYVWFSHLPASLKEEADWDHCEIERE
jgi:serine/threonine protein kinase